MNKTAIKKIAKSNILFYTASQWLLEKVLDIKNFGGGGKNIKQISFGKGTQIYSRDKQQDNNRTRMSVGCYDVPYGGQQQCY